MADRRTKEQDESLEKPRKASPPSSSTGEPADTAGKKRKPRGALFHGEDSTLAKRAEKELHTFGR